MTTQPTGLPLDAADPTGVAVRDQLLFDLFVTAVPLAIVTWSHGYFRAVDRYHFSAKIVDYDLRDHRIDRTTMVRGLLAAAYSWRERIDWSTEYPPDLFQQQQGWVFNDADADAVIQLGLYHDMPYSTENLVRRGIILRPLVLQES